VCCSCWYTAGLFGRIAFEHVLGSCEMEQQATTVSWDDGTPDDEASTCVHESIDKFILISMHTMLGQFCNSV